MSKGLIGKKLGMSSVFSAEGKFIPVTVLEVGPCVVTQIKTQAVDGYDALQLGFGEKKAKQVTKPIQGHLAKSGGKLFATLKEFPVDDPSAYELGQSLGAGLFKVGERIDLTGTTKGRGFAGVIKRHGFSRGRMTHGSHSIREPGSIGCSAWPAKVFKGKKLPGQYGNSRKTVRNLEIVEIRPEENLILIQGAVPGSRYGWVTINKLKFSK
ncbi:MAG: 50S ribosomal protein L3 [Desulfobacterales bacterium]